MLKNYFNVALRSLLRNRSATAIKILSLGVGMICFSVIGLFINHELSFDKFHDQHQSIYRIVKDFVNDDGTTVPDATTPPAFGPAIQRDVPEVSYTTRIFPNWGRKYLLSVGDKKSYEEKVVRIDSSFFNVFTFPFVKGEPSTALQNTNFILITESAARRFFGDEDPMGKAIKIDLSPEGTDFFVTGVLKDVPEQSHFTFDFLISIRTFIDPYQLDTDWNFYNFYTYARVAPGTTTEIFQSKVQNVFKTYQPENTNYCYVQQLSDIHLKSHLKWELAANGDFNYIRILGTIAIFVLVLASINYVNLVTAQSAKRAKEVGVRKVSGAVKDSLVRQFLFESTILAIVATLISIAIVEAILPLLINMFGTELSFFSPNGSVVLYIVAGVGVATGLLAGFYPAFYLSSFQPVKVLKGGLTGIAHGNILRKALVTIQFVISTVLIIGTLVISSQIDYAKNKKMGFSKDNVLLIHNTRGIQNINGLQTELEKIKGVELAGAANGVLGGLNWTTSVQAKGQENELLLNFIGTDYNFLEVMGVEFKDGRNFSKSTRADTLAIIVNETAVKQLGIKAPVLGSQISLGTDGNNNTVWAHVIGVIGDFHFTSFHEPIKPFGFFLQPDGLNKIFLRIDSKNIPETIDQIETLWNKLVSDRPFEYSFQDEQVAKLYASEVRFQSLFTKFTMIAIVLACLGLFGLSAYSAQQRIKEIGIRKVLGASVLSVIKLLSAELIKLVAIAILIAMPIAFYVMDQWLANFVYHTEMNVSVFLVAIVFALGIAIFTVSFQSIRAAISNPVDALKNE